MTTAGSNNGTIRKRVLIRASPTIVFQALTAAKDLAQWFCDRAVSDPQVGGELVAYWRAGKSGLKGRALFTQIVPESRVDLLWVDEGRDPAVEQTKHVLTYMITQKRGNTEVTMVDEDDPPPDDETYNILASGWNNVLLELKDYCERKERTNKFKAPDPD